MPTLSLEKWREEAHREKEMLSAGETPPPKLKNAQQRWAAKALAGFFSLMVLLTLLSRAADGLTVALVEVAEAKTGILTQRITVNGTLEAQGDLPLNLPGVIEVLRVVAKTGQRVQAGDVLLELDQEGLESSLEKLRNDLSLLDLRIAATEQGNTGATADTLWNAQEAVVNAQEGLRSAQQALEEARADYDRLVQSRETAEDRSAEDTAQAVADLERAEAELEKAIQKAKEELVKAAQEKVDAAQETLTELEEAADEEKKSAQEALSDAQKQQSSTADSLSHIHI